MHDGRRRGGHWRRWRRAVARGAGAVEMAVVGAAEVVGAVDMGRKGAVETPGMLSDIPDTSVVGATEEVGMVGRWTWFGLAAGTSSRRRPGGRRRDY